MNVAPGATNLERSKVVKQKKKEEEEKETEGRDRRRSGRFDNLTGSQEDAKFRRKKMIGKEKEEEKYLNAESPNLTPLSSTRDTQKDCSSYLDVGCVEDSRAPSSSPEAW